MLLAHAVGKVSKIDRYSRINISVHFYYLSCLLPVQVVYHYCSMVQFERYYDMVYCFLYW